MPVVVNLANGDLAVTVTITDIGNSCFNFAVTQASPSGVHADIRGLFFDVVNEALVSGTGTQASIQTGTFLAYKTLDLSGTPLSLTNVTSILDGNDTVTKTGGSTSDNTMSGALFKNGTGQEALGYDVGMEFGTSGIAKDDIGSVKFTFKLPGATLNDFIGMDFGARLTSVGVGTIREDSLKLVGTGYFPVTDPDEHAGCFNEDGTYTGDPGPAPANLLSTDPAAPLPGGETVTQTITGFTVDVAGDNLAPITGTIGSPTAIGNTGALITVKADGTYTIDTSLSDLAPDQHLDVDVHYAVHQIYKDAGGLVIGVRDETSDFTFDVCGVDDGGGETGDPDANTGLSPGYWRTHNGDGIPSPDTVNDWDIPQDTKVEEFFGVNWEDLPDTFTFLDAINNGGGGIYALARQVVSTYLSLIDEDNGSIYTVSFPYDPAVIADGTVDTVPEFKLFVQDIDDGNAAEVQAVTLFLHDNHI